MKILLVGRTGVFDTLAVACGYLKMDIHSCSYLGDLGLENNKSLIKVGTDHNGIEILIVGFNIPKIISAINRDIHSICKLNNQGTLLVIPLCIEGETFSWVLTKLANLPLIGDIFLMWAKNRTLRRSPYLQEMGKNLSFAKYIKTKANEDLVFAAKPHKD